jgi:hypothetical protein
LLSLREPQIIRQMNEPFARASDTALEFLQVLVEENASIASDVVQVADNLWAVHGFIAVDGDVLMAEFESYELAAYTLDLLPQRTQRRDDIAVTPR